MLIDGLEWCALLVGYCDVFIHCLDSYSDGTHSLQRIDWWASDLMLHFSKSGLMKKQTLLHLGWPELESFFNYCFKMLALVGGTCNLSTRKGERETCRSLGFIGQPALPLESSRSMTESQKTRSTRLNNTQDWPLTSTQHILLTTAPCPSNIKEGGMWSILLRPALGWERQADLWGIPSSQPSSFGKF